MTVSLYDSSIPAFRRALQNMSGFLEKARTWADETGLEHDELLNASLHPDMVEKHDFISECYMP